MFTGIYPHAGRRAEVEDYPLGNWELQVSGIVYLWHAGSHSLVGGSDWLLTVLYLLAMIAVTVVFGQFIYCSRL